MCSKKTVLPDQLVEALVVIRQSPGTSASMKTLLRDAEAATGLKPASVTEYPNMNAFNVQAARTFVEAIAHAPSVQEVIPSGGEDSAKIAPVAKRQVNLSDITSVTGKSRLRKTLAGG